jgi:hypothetical protein
MAPQTSAKVVNLMDALRASLKSTSAETGPKKTKAKPGLPRRAGSSAKQELIAGLRVLNRAGHHARLDGPRVYLTAAEPAAGAVSLGVIGNEC